MASKIDARVRLLVRELNKLPGIITFSSCGGHLKPSIASQRPLEEFEVNFNVYPLLGGWRSLELIANAVADSDASDKWELTVWSVGGGTSVCFELAGYQNANPDLLAGEVKQLRDKFYDNPNC